MSPPSTQKSKIWWNLLKKDRKEREKNENLRKRRKKSLKELGHILSQIDSDSGK